jgi:hypothetical protein
MGEDLEDLKETIKAVLQEGEQNEDRFIERDGGWIARDNWKAAIDACPGCIGRRGGPVCPLPVAPDVPGCAGKLWNGEGEGEAVMTKRTLDNTDKRSTEANVSDVKTAGNPYAWKLICKASSEAEGWMRSTKALQVEGGGCLVQVSTLQRDVDGYNSVAEALTYVPGVIVIADKNGGCKLVDEIEAEVREGERS